jgi:hypothetical protein
MHAIKLQKSPPEQANSYDIQDIHDPNRGGSQ